MALKETQWALADARQALPRDAATARAQVRDTKVPLLYYTDRSPRAWATHGAERCWARPKTVHGHTWPTARRIQLRIRRIPPKRHASIAASWERSWPVSLMGKCGTSPSPP